jgi:hypothetical protein
MTYNQVYEYIKQYLITSTAGTLCTGIVGVDYEATITSAVITVTEWSYKSLPNERNVIRHMEISLLII